MARVEGDPTSPADPTKPDQPIKKSLVDTVGDAGPNNKPGELPDAESPQEKGHLEPVTEEEKKHGEVGVDG